MRLQPFSPKHEDSLLDSTARINMWEGAIRSAKTMISIIRWLDYMESEAPEGGALLMVGKTEKTLRMNVIDPILELVGEKRFKVNRGDGTIRYAGRKAWMVGANDERAEMKIRGLTAAGVYGDQVETFPESFFLQAIGRMSLPGAKLFGTCNPEGPRHWLKSGFLDRENELNLRRFHFRLEDNTALPEEYVRDLKLDYGPPGSLWYRRYILGLWVLAEGVIYDMLDEDRHVVHIVPPAIEVPARHFGFDYGTANPFHGLCGEVRRDPDGVERIYVIAEYRYDSKARSRQLTDAEYSREVRAWIGDLPYDRLHIDPSAASFMNQLYHDGVRGVNPADNAVLDGIRIVSTLLARDRLRISKDCIHLLDELSGYSWDPKAQAKGEDKPLKVDDHGPDALRYLVMGLRRYWRRWISWEPRKGAEHEASA